MTLEELKLLQFVIKGGNWKIDDYRRSLVILDREIKIMSAGDEDAKRNNRQEDQR